MPERPYAEPDVPVKRERPRRVYVTDPEEILRRYQEAQMRRLDASTQKRDEMEATLTTPRHQIDAPVSQRVTPVSEGVEYQSTTQPDISVEQGDLYTDLLRKRLVGQQVVFTYLGRERPGRVLEVPTPESPQSSLNTRRVIILSEGEKCDSFVGFIQKYQTYLTDNPAHGYLERNLLGRTIDYWRNGICIVDKKVINIIEADDVAYEDRQVRIEGSSEPVYIRDIEGYQEILGLGH